MHRAMLSSSDLVVPFGVVTTAITPIDLCNLEILPSSLSTDNIINANGSLQDYHFLISEIELGSRSRSNCWIEHDQTRKYHINDFLTTSRVLTHAVLRSEAVRCASCSNIPASLKVDTM